MTEPTTVVFGDDGSAACDVAWLWIQSQHWAGSRLEVVTADAPQPGMVVEQGAKVRAVEGDPPRIAFDEADFDRVDFLEVAGDPRVVLSDRTDASLVVVGAAHEGIGRWHIGSTTEWLLQGPPAPLVVAHVGRPVRRALVCADGSSHSLAAAAGFSAQPWAAEAEVTLLSIDDGRTDPDASIGAATPLLTDVGCAVEHSVRSGKPEVVVLQEAEAIGADLIVLGAKGLSVLRRLTLGSTATAVSRHPDAAVLVACASAEA